MSSGSKGEWMAGGFFGRGRRAGSGPRPVGALLRGLLGAVLLTGCVSAADGTPDADGTPRAGSGSAARHWVNPEGSAARQVAAYRAQGRTEEAELIEKIAEQPVADWLGTRDPEGEARRLTRAAAHAGRSALLVLYNIPARDCGQYSQGGAADAEEYRAWLAAAARGIGERGATVILEPDALPHLLDGCTPEELHEERYALLREAVHTLAELPRTRVYLDAGNPGWISDPGALVEPLRRAGIDAADGFALNTSNYRTTEANTAYGKRLGALLGGKHFVIDTSRNGNGPLSGAEDAQTWCNPPGRALGEPPTTDTGEELVDAYLWIKRPGESDGECRGGPPAGRWWPRYALELARNAG